MLNVRWGEIHLLGALFVFEPIPEQWITLGESLCTLAALMSLAFYPWVLYIPLPSHASKELLTPLHTFLYIRPVIQSGPRIQLHSKTCNTPIMSRISFSAGIWDNFSKLHHTVYACYKNLGPWQFMKRQLALLSWASHPILCLCMVSNTVGHGWLRLGMTHQGKTNSVNCNSALSATQTASKSYQ